MVNLSQYDQLLRQPKEVQDKFLASFSAEEIETLMYDVEFTGRPSQILPQGDWYGYLVLSGRGYGKNWMASHQITRWAKNNPGCIIHLVAETAADVRNIIVGGPSGILKLSHPKFRPDYQPSKRLLTWPNGSTALTFSGEEPDQLRGPQCHYLLIDEVAKYAYAQELYDMATMGLRLGVNPQVLITSTPRPIPLIKQVIADPSFEVIRGSTFENHHLPQKFLDQLKLKYQGTRLGRQELYAEILTDNPDALFSEKDIERGRVTDHPPLERIVVAVDPAVTTNESSDETGIVASGLAKHTEHGHDITHAYVLEDATLKASVSQWARQAVAVYHRYDANLIVAEVNNGGDLVQSVLLGVDDTVRYKKIHSSRGKAIRAEPIQSLMEQNRIHMVGHHPDLEREMLEWSPSVPGLASPNRMDALVFACTELLVTKTVPQAHIYFA